MARQNKKVLRRKIAQAWQHQARTVEIMTDMAVMFDEHHKDYAEYMQAIAQSAYITMEFIQDVATKAWGYWPEDVETWLK